MLREPDQTPLQRGIKVGTALVTVVLLGGLLLADWGPNNVFSGVRPAVKSTLNRFYKVDRPEDK
jgi:hypothetical protein